MVIVGIVQQRAADENIAGGKRLHGVFVIHVSGSLH
jgi:hypothetical protein